MFSKTLLSAILEYNQPFSNKIQYLENKLGNSLEEPVIAAEGS